MFKDYPTFRQWVQVVGAAVLAALVSYSIIPSADVQLWVALLAAVFPPVLSVFNSADTLRTFLYGVIAAVQALIIGLSLADAAHVDPIVNIVLAAIGAGVAVTHTPTPKAVEPLRA